MIFAALLALALAPLHADRPATLATTPTPSIGIGVNVADGSPEAGQAALDMVRRTGATFFVLELSWSAAEPRPREYRLDEIKRSARLLRQSGATLHLSIPLVSESARDVPSDLTDTAFDDPKLSLRLGRLLDALEPVLLDVQTLSLGDAADTYFADKPDELRAYRRLFDGAVQFLEKKAPRLLVGVTTAAPTESRSPQVAAELHRRSPVLFYDYCPLVASANAPFTQRDPDVLEKDWAALLGAAGERPIAFPRVSYSSSAENGSSPQKQAEFVRQFRRFLSRTDGRKLLFARYLWLRDPAELPEVSPGASVAERRRRALLGNIGLQDPSGRPKPAWTEWLRESAGVKR